MPYRLGEPIPLFLPHLAQVSLLFLSFFRLPVLLDLDLQHVMHLRQLLAQGVGADVEIAHPIAYLVGALLHLFVASTEMLQAGVHLVAAGADGLGVEADGVHLGLALDLGLVTDEAGDSADLVDMVSEDVGKGLVEAVESAAERAGKKPAETRAEKVEDVGVEAGDEEDDVLAVRP